VEEIKKMKIGDPLDRSTDHGPQNHKAHLEKLLKYCETGVKEGATLVYGGRQVRRPGKIMLKGLRSSYVLNKSQHGCFSCLTECSNIMARIQGKPKKTPEERVFESHIKKCCATEIYENESRFSSVAVSFSHLLVLFMRHGGLFCNILDLSRAVSVIISTLKNRILKLCCKSLH